MKKREYLSNYGPGRYPRSDRGYTMLLDNIAGTHLSHAYLHTKDQETHLSNAQKICRGILDYGCTQHATRARMAAINNLTVIPVFFDNQQADAELIGELRRYHDQLSLKNTLQGARIRWVLVRDKITEQGYCRALRIRLLRLRDRLVKHKAWPDAALLILDIVGLDLAENHRRAALFLLRKSEELFERANLMAIADDLLRIYQDLTIDNVFDARRVARQSFVKSLSVDRCPAAPPVNVWESSTNEASPHPNVGILEKMTTDGHRGIPGGYFRASP